MKQSHTKRESRVQRRLRETESSREKIKLRAATTFVGVHIRSVCTSVTPCATHASLLHMVDTCGFLSECHRPLSLSRLCNTLALCVDAPGGRSTAEPSIVASRGPPAATPTTDDATQ